MLQNLETESKQWGLMIAIVGMGVVVNPAGAVVLDMPGNDQDHGWYQEPGFIPDKKQLGREQGNAEAEQEERGQAVVVAAVAMVK